MIGEDKNTGLETQLKDCQELLEKAQGELVEARADRETLIDQYMNLEEYQGLIAQHKARIQPRFLFRG